MLKSKLILSGMFFGVLLGMNTSMAETHTVSVNGMKYEPLVVKVEPGDTVAWVNMNTHNIDALDGMVPKGEKLFKSKMSENYQHTFEIEGIYVYQCTPHIGAGMGGAVIVGEPNNLEKIKALDAKGRIGRVVKKTVEEAESI